MSVGTFSPNPLAKWPWVSMIHINWDPGAPVYTEGFSRVGLNVGNGSLMALVSTARRAHFPQGYTGFSWENESNRVALIAHNGCDNKKVLWSKHFVLALQPMSKPPLL